jgi:hypothetical protein
VDIKALTEKLASAAREATKFNLEVKTVPAESLGEGVAPIRDERTWD